MLLDVTVVYHWQKAAVQEMYINIKNLKIILETHQVKCIKDC